MKQIVVALFLFIFFGINGFSQKSLSDYAYVLVPQQFEFQKGIDQYQVNTLLRHLLKETGFNPIYEVEVKGLPRCDGLYADLIINSNFISTTIAVALKDCNNDVIYLSEPGSSKEKEYKKGYHQALRRAFRSIEVLGVNQGDLNTFRESIEKRDAAIVSSQTIEVKPVVFSENLIKENKWSAYTNDEVTYYLEPKNDGFVIYEKQKNQIVEVGTLSKTSRLGTFILNQDGKNLLAGFDEDKNLIIDTEDNQGNPSQRVFLKVDKN